MPAPVVDPAGVEGGMRRATGTARLGDALLGFGLALLLAAALVAISELGYRRAARQLDELVLMGQNRLELARVASRISDAESSQRGYLLTARPDYLAPYQAARTDVDRGLQRLAELQALRHPGLAGSSVDSEADRADLKALDASVRTKLSEMNEVLGLFELGRREAANELMLTGIGREAMVSVRSASDRLLARENARVATGLRLVFDSLLLNRVGIAAGAAVSLLLVALVLRQRHQAGLLREAQQQAIKAERDRLEQEVAHRTAELTSLARHLETAREDERARLARDLHDELGALLTAAKLDLARMRPGLQQSAPALLPRVEHLVQMLNSGIALKRRIIEDLRPSSLDNLGLVPALEILCSECAERLQVQLQTSLQAVNLSPAAELTTFRLVQESLSNIAKHAQARRVTVALAPQEDGNACIRITDDGMGFDPARLALGSHGLVGMRYRVQAEGGTLVITSRPGTGTQVQALLPQVQATPAGASPDA